MADVAWIELHKLAENRSEVVPVAISELNLGSFEVFRPTGPDDYRIPLGIQTTIRQVDGSRIFVTEDFNTLADLVKIKRQ